MFQLFASTESGTLRGRDRLVIKITWGCPAGVSRTQARRNGSSDRAAQNYGRQTQPAHDLRYEMAKEMTDAVCAPWSSCDADVVVAEIADGLVPELQVRGLARTCHDSPLLRGNLASF